MLLQHKVGGLIPYGECLREATSAMGWVPSQLSSNLRTPVLFPELKDSLIAVDKINERIF